MIRKTTPERLSFFSDAIFAVLITVLVLELRPPERPTFEALLERWPTWLSYAVSYLFIAIVWANHHYLLLCQGSNAAFDVVQLRPSLFRLAAAALYRLDGGEQASPQPVAFYAAVFFFVNVTYILLIWELIEPRADVASKVRRNMRYRSIATLCLFGIASLVALKYPFLGLGICCFCLVGYLRPGAPGAN